MLKRAQMDERTSQHQIEAILRQIIRRLLRCQAIYERLIETSMGNELRRKIVSISTRRAGHLRQLRLELLMMGYRPPQRPPLDMWLSLWLCVNERVDDTAALRRMFREETGLAAAYDRAVAFEASAELSETLSEQRAFVRTVLRWIEAQSC